MSEKNEQSLDPIPVDVLFEILMRLPAKDVARFLCVSKFWATIIGGREFIRSYSLQTSQQPRLLFAFNNEIKGYQENWYFFSKSTHVSTPLSSCEREPVNGRFSQGHGGASLVNKVAVVEEEPPEFLSSTVCHLKKLRYNKPSYVHGLICFLYGEEQVVTNPVTGKSITLPTLKSTEMIVRSFLGYDPIDAQYKVLCLTNVTRFCEHQVLTLGGAQNWRMVQYCCIPPHYPGYDSVCIDGILYYSASSSCTMKEPFLVGFDLRSESLEVASLIPEGLGSLNETNLINYRGKVALVTQSNGIVYHFYLWVLQDAKKQEWSKEHLSFHTGVTRNLHRRRLEILGVSDMGEIVFAPIRFEELVVYFLDHKTNRIRRVVLEGNPKHKFRDFNQVFTFLHNVESVLFL
ncbi:PREDICTED: F-box protein At1g47810-like [Camelina sativa]|uniref:F-box protein At1g47810-like n=1 Tax=Camelina sativa TaxID=90675 RepID=A0ABM0W6X2_CAMSA|nr:PREDICTED: F-box protein At1g47810-like [Camelina sativa]